MRKPIGDSDEMEAWETYVVVPTVTVHEPEEPTASGLVDADGNALVRQRNPIGFLAEL